MSPSPINALAAGTRLTSGSGFTYTLTKVIGSGGFGITYLGTLNTKVGNITASIPVAIKEFFPSKLCERAGDTASMSYSNPIADQVRSAQKDFMGEARRLNALSGRHPNIVAVNEVFEANNTVYYVMECLSGESLKQYVETHGPMSESAMLSVMLPVVSAVAFLHREHMTHLDIKPANIMLAEATANDPARPVLIDFGLSKHYDDNGDPTSTLNAAGYSDGYAPREQYRGISTFTPQADVYALGATMVFCLTGRRLPPSLDLDDEQLAAAIPANISPALRHALLGALALSKNKRLPDAQALLDALPVNTADTDPIIVNIDLDDTNRAVTPQPTCRQKDSGPKPPSTPAKPVTGPIPTPSPQNKTKKRLWLTLITIGIALAAISTYLYLNEGGGSEPSDYVDSAKMAAEAAPTPMAADQDIRAEEEVQPAPDVLRELLSSHYHNLDLAVRVNGITGFLSQNDWKSLSSTDKNRCQKLGLIVTNSGAPAFMLSLDCSEPMTWDDAVSRYGESKLPSEKQCRAMAEDYKAINNAILAYGGNVPGDYNWYWGKEYNSAYAWVVNMPYGHVYYDGKTYAGRVRAVAPVPVASAM